MWRYGCFVGSRCDFPIFSHIKAENTQMLIISIWIMLETSSLDHKSSIRRETFSDHFVKIRNIDVTWHHMTLFYLFNAKNCQNVLENCLRQQQLTNMVLSFTIYLWEHYNSVNLRGKPSFYDKWINFYDHLHEDLIFADFCWLLWKNADVSKKYASTDYHFSFLFYQHT